MEETPEMPRKRPSPKKRIFAWGINDTLKKRSRYDDENESLLIENGAELDKEEKKKDCDLISAVKSLDEAGVSFLENQVQSLKVREHRIIITSFTRRK